MLRRAVGRPVHAAVVVLMRPESIETTLWYYVGQNAVNAAKTLWWDVKSGRFGNTLGNSAAEAWSANAEAPPQPFVATELKK